MIPYHHQKLILLSTRLGPIMKPFQCKIGYFCSNAADRHTSTKTTDYITSPTSLAETRIHNCTDRPGNSRTHYIHMHKIPTYLIICFAVSLYYSCIIWYLLICFGFCKYYVTVKFPFSSFALICYDRLHCYLGLKELEMWPPGSADMMCLRPPLVTQVHHFVSRIKKRQR